MFYCVMCWYVTAQICNSRLIDVYDYEGLYQYQAVLTRAWWAYPVRLISADKRMGLNSLSSKASYRKISWSRESARFGFGLFHSIRNLTDTSAAALPRRLSNFRTIRSVYLPISGLLDFTRFGGETSYCFVNRSPGVPLKFWGNNSQIKDLVFI